MNLNIKHEELRNEILNNENISEELKNKMISLKEEFEQKWAKEDKFIEDNKDRKIIGYDIDSYLPIFE